MAHLRIEVDARRALDQLGRMLPALAWVPRKASHKGAEKIKDHAQEILSALEHAPETLTPSPEGFPPARITGELAESILVTPVGNDADVGPTAHYCRFLELGGTHVGNMRW